jgi:hypothetical protein
MATSDLRRNNRLHFHTRHLMLLMIAVAFVLAIIRHPEALLAPLVALIGGLFVVVPILGAAEFMSSRDSATPDVGWLGGCLIGVIAVVGMVLAAMCLFALATS